MIANFITANCPQCDSSFYLPPELATAVCPFCARDSLTPLTADEAHPLATQPPELLLPFTVTADVVQTRLTNFAKKTWLPPADLNPTQLQQRLQKLYLPLWLVDAHVTAQWQAEMGYNYQVVSHREKYKSGQWQTEQIQETKIRWEPRLGTLQREYHNQPAPALEEQLYLEKGLGTYRWATAQPYQPHSIEAVPIRLPNRPPESAWGEAQVGLKQTAAGECQQAAQADHLREYRWKAQFAQQNWTQLLYPLYTTYYHDDNGVVRRIYLHGQDGRLVGERYASMKTARRWALAIALIAGLVFVLGLAVGGASLVWEELLLVALLLLFGAMGLGVTAVGPFIVAWYANQFKYVAENKIPFLR